MGVRCSRCGLAIGIPTGFCPACGIELSAHGDETSAARDNYYDIFSLLPTSSNEQIREALKNAYRLWSRRANNSTTIELRHEAERKVLLIQEAEATLLNPAKRQAYDLMLRERRSHSKNNSRPLPVPARRRPSSASATTTSGSNLPDQSATNIKNDTGGSLWPRFSKLVLEGTIIQVDTPYMGHPDFSWGGLLIKVTLLILGVLLIGPVVIGIFGGLMLVALMFRFLFPRGSSHLTGCLSSIASQVIGFLLTKRLLSPKPDVPVRDFRLRDDQGQEHLVRIKGEIVAGNMNVGDEVEVEGRSRRGTFILRRGRNKRTRSEIRVRR